MSLVSAQDPSSCPLELLTVFIKQNNNNKKNINYSRRQPLGFCEFRANISVEGRFRRLPDPVTAQAHISRPFRATGIHADCIGVG